MTTQPSDLFQRAATNPILAAGDVPYAVNAVFNPGAARIGDETILLARIEDLRGISQLHVARSRDGVSDWRFDPEPLLRSEVDHYPEEIWGCEDPRLTWLAEREEWSIAYTAYSRRGPLVSLAMSKDFTEVRRLGPAMPPEDKDAALFPRRFGGRWAMIHRPSPLRGGAHMWLSFSPDLRHWGDHTLLLEARDGAWWDAGKIGLGPPPLETREGWLVMYHGVHSTADGPIYRAGLALLDLTIRGESCIGRTSGCLVLPRPTRSPGTSGAWCFRPAGPRTSLTIDSWCTTERPTASWGWPSLHSARSSRESARPRHRPRPASGDGRKGDYAGLATDLRRGQVSLRLRPRPTRRSTLAAMMKSLALRAPIASVVHETTSRPQDSSIAG